MINQESDIKPVESVGALDSHCDSELNGSPSGCDLALGRRREGLSCCTGSGADSHARVDKTNNTYESSVRPWSEGGG
jgi:hypothetical protein